MSSIYPIYTDRVRYRLYHNPTGVIDIKEPKGFRDDENEFIRDKNLTEYFLRLLMT